MRESDGAECHTLERFAEAVGEIRSRAPEAIIQVSTRAAVGEGIDYRGNCLELRTEMCSLNVGSIPTLRTKYFSNSPPDVRRLAARIYELGIEPELDCFDLGHLESLVELRRRGILRAIPCARSSCSASAAASRRTRATWSTWAPRLPPGADWSAA